MKTLMLMLMLVFVAAGCLRAPAKVASPRASEHVAYGVHALENGELDRAEAEFHLALEYEARMPQAMNGLGLVSMARGDRDEARRWFRGAIRANDDFAEAHANLGAVEMEDGHADAAVPHLMAALAIDPGYVPARHNLARALLSLGRLELAREEYMKLSSTDRDNADAWAELAVVELALGNRAAAGRAATTALALEPAHLLARRVRADLRRDGGDLDGAVEEYTAILVDAPSNVDALIGRGMSLLLLGRPDEAKLDLARAVALAPASPMAHFALGVALAELEDHAGAEAAYARSVELAAAAGRGYPEAHYLRAASLAQLGRKREAIASYRQFLREAGADARLADAVTDAQAQIAHLERQG